MSENLFGLTVAADKGLDDLQCQRLLSENRRYQEVMLQYRCALKALESRLEILNEEFSLQHDRNPIESMKSRLKSPSSIMNKMQKRGLPLDFPTMQANIMDVAGVRVICSFEEDVFFLAKCLKDQSDIGIITEKDYISHPKPNGYRSLHLTIRLPVFFAEKEIHVPVEIQLRTIAMDFWASLEHTIRYKKNLPINAEVETELKECADSSREWDSKMEHLRKRTIITRTEQNYGRVPLAGLCRSIISVYVPGAGLPGARASAFPAPHGSEICPDRAAYSAPAIDTHKAQCRWPWPFPPANTQWHRIPLP